MRMDEFWWIFFSICIASGVNFDAATTTGWTTAVFAFCLSVVVIAGILLWLCIKLTNCIYNRLL